MNNATAFPSSTLLRREPRHYLCGYTVQSTVLGVGV